MVERTRLLSPTPGVEGRVHENLAGSWISKPFVASSAPLFVNVHVYLSNPGGISKYIAANRGRSSKFHRRSCTINNHTAAPAATTAAPVMTVFHNKRPRLSLSSVQKATGELVVEVLHCQKSLQGLRRVGLVLNYVRTVVSAAFPPPVQTTPARHVGCLLAALDIASKRASSWPLNVGQPWPIFQNGRYAANACRRPIKMSPLCQLQLTLPGGFS